MRISYLCLLQFAFINAISCLRLLYHRIPRSFPVGHDVKLTCEFDLEGETLVAVKWFHNGEEFYRFSPEDRPTSMYFPTSGIKLDMRRTTNTSVVLRDLEYKSTGLFRCEILADAPRFKTVTAEAYMSVEAFYSGKENCRGSWLLLTCFIFFVTFSY